MVEEAATRYGEAPGAETLSGAGLRAFFGLAEAWGLSVEEQLCLLGGIPRSTYYHWKQKNGKGLKLSRDTLERLSYLLGIYKALHILFPDPTSADGWIRRPNHAPLFGGRTALDRMLSGQVSDLYEVRRYLDAERGGWN